MSNPTATADLPGELPELQDTPFATRMIRIAVPAAALLVSFAILYRNVIAQLVQDWSTDDNFSHGFLIVPIALYLAWERRDRLMSLQRRPAALGLLVVLGSIAVLAAGTLGAERFLARVSMLGVLSGTIIFMFGWRHLTALAFPVAFLILMIPWPVLIFNQIAFPLQLIASQFGESVLSTLNIPVLREGNVIILAHTKLEVAEACSGIRSLLSLVTLGVVYGYFADQRQFVRVVIAASTIPVAIFANGLRVAGTGVAAQYYGPAAAQGFFHTFSGWVVFVVAFAALFGLRWILECGLRVAGRGRLQDAMAS